MSVLVYMSPNPIQHRRMKHIEIDIHFFREKVSLGLVRVLHVPFSLQFIDVMMKGLLSSDTAVSGFSVPPLCPRRFDCGGGNANDSV